LFLRVSPPPVLKFFPAPVPLKRPLPPFPGATLSNPALCFFGVWGFSLSGSTLNMFCQIPAHSPPTPACISLNLPRFSCWIPPFVWFFSCGSLLMRADRFLGPPSHGFPSFFYCFCFPTSRFFAQTTKWTRALSAPSPRAVTLFFLPPCPPGFRGSRRSFLCDDGTLLTPVIAFSRICGFWGFFPLG